MKRLEKSSTTASSTAWKKLFVVTVFSAYTVDYPFFYTVPFPNQQSGRNFVFVFYTLDFWIIYKFFKHRFGAFEEFKKRSVDANGNLSAGNRLLCGLGAGIAEAIFAVTPMETVKVKFINDQRSANPQFKGFFHGVRTIIKNEGEWKECANSCANLCKIYAIFL